MNSNIILEVGGPPDSKYIIPRKIVKKYLDPKITYD